MPFLRIFMFLLAQKCVYFYTIILGVRPKQAIRPNSTQEVCYETTFWYHFNNDITRFYDSLCKQNNN